MAGEGGEARPRAKFVDGNLLGHITVMSLTSSVGLMAIFAVDLMNMLFISWLKDEEVTAAVGYAGITDLDQTQIELHLDDVHVVTQGGRHPAYREEDGARVMQQSEITIRVGLGRGDVADTVWTCDFSHEYVTINADYRS